MSLKPSTSMSLRPAPDPQGLSKEDAILMAKIEAAIAEPPERVASVIVTLSPGVSKLILKKYNIRNRPRRPRGIARMAADMRARKFLLTGDSIKFSDKQRLIDGQNRLEACVQAGTAFRTHMVFGIDDKAFDVLDQGSVRTVADILSIEGHANSVILSAALRWAVTLDKVQMDITTKKPTRLKVHEAAALIKHAFPDLHLSIRPAMQLYAARRIQPSPLVAVHRLLVGKVGRDEADLYFSTWASGSHRKYLGMSLLQAQLDKCKLHRPQIPGVALVVLTIKAINAGYGSRPVTEADITYKVGEAIPQLEIRPR